MQFRGVIRPQQSDVSLYAHGENVNVNGLGTVGMVALRFRAALAGTRKLSLTYYTAADNTGGEANTLEIRERLPDGNEQLLVRRMRVPYGRGLKEDSAFSFHPYGGADSNDRPSRHQKLNWPAAASECLLQPEAIRVGETLRIHGMPLAITAAADAATHEWLTSQGLPAGPPPNEHNVAEDDDIKARAMAYAAAGATAEGAIYGGEYGAAVWQRAAAVAESRQLHGDPTLDELKRFRAAQRRAKHPDPVEAERHSRALHFGDRAVHFRAVAAIAGEPRHFFLAFFLADDTLQVHEVFGVDVERLSGGGAGPAGARPERVALLRRLRAPNRESASGFVELRDLRIGAVIPIQGVPLRLVACEPSSRALLEGLAREGALGLGASSWQLGEDAQLWKAKEEASVQRAAQAQAARERAAETARALQAVAETFAALAAQQEAKEAVAKAMAMADAEADLARMHALRRAMGPMGTTARAHSVDMAIRQARVQGQAAGGRVGSEREPKKSIERVFGGDLAPLPLRVGLSKRHNPPVADTIARLFGRSSVPTVTAAQEEPIYVVEVDGG